jgi:hypothetical protein
MYDTTKLHIFPRTSPSAFHSTELTIVPCPQRDAWAVVNRQGDTLAVGQYGQCLRHMHRLTAATAAAA